MAFAITHAFLSLWGVEGAKLKWKRFRELLPKYYVLWGLFAGIIPDLDFSFSALSMMGIGIPHFLLHRSITHTFFFFLIFLIPGLFFWKKRKDIAMVLFICAFGSLLHVLTDFVLSAATDGIAWLWPFSNVGFSANIFLFPTPLFGLMVYSVLDLTTAFSWFWFARKRIVG